MRRLIQTIVILAIAVEASAQSHPVFFMETARENARLQMKTDYEADGDCTTDPSTVSSAACVPATYGGKMYKLAHDNSASNSRYSDLMGAWGAFMFRACKDAGDADAICNAYRDQSYAKLTTNFLGLADTATALCGNTSREHFIAWVLQYDWLYEGLSAGQRTAFLTKLKTAANLCVTGAKYGTGYDSDQTIGDYFGMAMLECATGSYDATVDGYWGDVARKIGGYASTAADNATRRNVIRSYVETLAGGGEWIEGDHYNIGTLKLLLVGAEAVRSCQATDNYTEITTWTPDLADTFMEHVTPGLDHETSKPLQWGDEEAPRSLLSYYRWETGAVIAGLLGGTAAGQRIQDWALDYIDSAANGITSIDPYPRAYYLFDPYATRGDHTTTATYRYASGVGLMLKRTSWADGHLFGATFQPYLGFSADRDALTHHSVYSWGEFQWWKGTGSTGEWIITHPLGYQSPGGDVRGTNGLALEGHGLHSTYQHSALQYRSVRAEQDNTTNGFTYITGTMGGFSVRRNYYGTPDPYVMEHTRSLVFIPGIEAMVVFDRANVKDPTTEGYYSSYSAAVKTAIEAAPRVQASFHMPVNPTLGSGYTEWPLTYNGVVRINHLLPTGSTVAAVNETTAWSTVTSLTAGEKKYHVTITPASEQQWNTFLNVIQRYSTTPKPVTAVRDTTALVDGVLITDGTTNRLVAFNAIQGPDVPTCARTGSTCSSYPAGTATILDTVRLRNASFSLTFSAAGGSTTKALLFDLDPGESWTYTINGGAPAELMVDADGVGVVDLTETGSVTLALIASGDLPVTISDGSLPVGRKGTAYSHQMTSLGGAGSPTWSKTVGTFQTGLSISEGGLISGTPTTAGDQAITLQACDPSPTNCGTRDYTLTVADVPDITTTSLADCPYGSAYSQTLEATGGTEPYTFSVESGTLPDGLSLAAATGAITGTCTGALGLSELTFRVTDDVAGTGDKALGITVTSALPTLTAAAQAGTTTAVVWYGIAGLPYDDSCTVYLKEGEATLDSATSTTGDARRAVTFSGLSASTTFGLDITCGTAASTQRTYFRTQAPTAALGTYTVKLKPTTATLARMTALDATLATARAAVYWKAPGEESFTATKAVCPTGCTVTFSSLASGVHAYYIGWESNSTAIASSAARPAYVPIP